MCRGVPSRVFPCNQGCCSWSQGLDDRNTFIPSRTRPELKRVAWIHTLRFESLNKKSDAEDTGTQAGRASEANASIAWRLRRTLERQRRTFAGRSHGEFVEAGHVGRVIVGSSDRVR